MVEKKKTAHDFEFVGRIINILKILYDKTDECTTITQPEILSLLNECGYSCSARTLADYLKMIMRELNPEDQDGYVDDRATIDDYRIIPKGLEEKFKSNNLGLASEGSQKPQLRSLKYNHTFSFDELNQLVEAVLFLKNIDDNVKKKLIEKLLTLSSENYPKHSPYISETTGRISEKIAGVYENPRINEAIVRDNLKIIRQAMKSFQGAGCKLSFHFNGYNAEKELESRRMPDGSLIRYVVNPFYVILYNGKYYLVCSTEPFTNVSIYRIDLMSDITNKISVAKSDGEKMVAEKRRPKRDIAGLPMNWNSTEASEFQAEHLYMYYGVPEPITLKLDRKRYTLLHDYFGEHYQFRRQLDEKWDEVAVKCVPDAMISWAMQCSDYVEVMKPDYLRDRILEKCKELVGRYQ
jgi:hypothetical protein